ncbi:MAG: hypothetical protein AB1697_04950 [Pseudomonadota bacterium]
MADTRPTPTNLDFWPGVTDLVNDYKHLLHVLWSSPPQVVDVLGVGRPGVIERLCGATRLDEPVVLDALRELDRRRLVALDEETREVAIRRWTAFHKFSGRWAKAAQDAYGKIASAKIKAILVKEEGVKSIFPLESKGTPPNSNTNINNNPTPPSPRSQAGGIDPPGGGSGVGRGESKSRGKTPTLPLEVEQAIQDELQGRQEATVKGEAPPISNPTAWLKKLRNRAAAGEDITTDHGRRVKARREAEARHMAALETPLVVDGQASAKGAALISELRAQREARGPKLQKFSPPKDI